ncbi:aspartyl/asparaginyl beta-hydroxylase domain-containing protein [Thioalkalivibrio sp. XN279]|uniref:aspartyl/asparaginyl beta-hydroxylase domain-containing protein n=1 Tax=Thioalkalivibrio sp. XN279 TaxID=2714953 RepID=UPI00140AB2E2|nr:aspartyl/asparaginyl beta-hydroxylase domain-containing protein [Thioalkalivibrio sp. XN279]NHA13635.1 aspartyl/asparaginyl beta-hydroxylase domain-containing protein [Thioalkalivibrio sp. XN279]
MKHFRLIRAGVELEPLRLELGRHSSAWDAQVGRQLTAPAQRHTNAIPLRGLRRSRIRGRRRRDVHESRWTALSKQFPATVAFIEQFAAEVRGTPGRARFACLPPGKTVLPHIDRGEYYRLRDRYHLVIRSEHGSVLNAGNESVRMREGELWWFDNKAVHDACNDSASDRIHLIFDLLPAGAEPSTLSADPGRLLEAELTGREQRAVEEVARAVALYSAARERPQRWARTLAAADLLELAQEKPLGALARILWPDLCVSGRAQRESAIAWSLGLLDTGRIRPAEVSQAILEAGGLDAVHRWWRADRDRAIYEFCPGGLEEDDAAPRGRLAGERRTPRDHACTG